MQTPPKERKPKKWLTALLVAALAALSVVAPQWLPVAEVIAEELEPSLWDSPEPLPVAR